MFPRTVFLMLMFTLCLAPLSLGMERSETLDLYSTAETAFNKGNELLDTNPKEGKIYFQEALVYFQAVRDRGGIENSRLYFNIGNCFFRTGDLGRAIVNYRRAERLSPGDTRIQENLALARSICRSGGEKAPRISALPALFSWYYGMDLTTRLWLPPAVSALFWGSIAIFLLRKNNRLRLLPITFGILTVFFGCLALLDIKDLHSGSGVIVSSKTIARKGCGLAFDHAFPEALASGTEFELVERMGGWYCIRLLNGKSGWIPSESAELIDHPGLPQDNRPDK